MKHARLFLDAVTGIASESGFMGIFQNPGYLIMIIIACVLLYLAIVKQFEPLLLLPIAFGMLLANLPFGDIIHMEFFLDGVRSSGFCERLERRRFGGYALFWALSLEFIRR